MKGEASSAAGAAAAVRPTSFVNIDRAVWLAISRCGLPLLLLQ